MSMVGPVLEDVMSSDKAEEQRCNPVQEIGHKHHHKLPPLVSALKISAEKNVARFHFPGHNRGRAAPSSLTDLIGDKPFHYDLVGIPGLDNFFSPQGPILDSQKQAASVFGSLETWFLVGGTTCGIQAAIMATCCPGDTLVLPRNAHVSAFSGMVLSGAVPKYIVPEYNTDWGIAGGITSSQVEKAFKELLKEGRKPAAVFITSPTYHGICSDLSKISELCHSHGVPVIADEAHGAHFKFHHQLPYSALEQGVDIVVQSTHKVLCSLTQSSMLHLSGNIVDRNSISQCLQTLQSTSPNHLLLASLDATTATLGENPNIFYKSVDLATEAKHLIQEIPGISVLDLTSFPKFPTIDPLRLTIGVWQLGLSGYEAHEILYRDQQVFAELIESRSITLVINLGTSREDIQRLMVGIKRLSTSTLSIQGSEKSPNITRWSPFTDFPIRLTPRDAFFQRKMSIDIRDSLGMICGELICPYPPGIPLMLPGEIITDAALNYLLELKNKDIKICGASDPNLSAIKVCTV